MIIQYTSKREPIPGRQIGDVDQLTFGLTRSDIIRKPNASTHRALNGKVTTRLHSYVTNIRLTTGIIKGDDVLLFREFLASCAGGEIFSVLFDDTDEAELYTLVNGQSESRVGNQEWFKFSFEIVKYEI